MPENALKSDKSSPIPEELLYSAEYAADPHAVHAALRATGPVHRIESPSGVRSFLVVDYEHARAALNDPRLSKDLTRLSKDLRSAAPELSERYESGGIISASNMLMVDPPDHTRLRRLVSKAFTPRRVQGLAPRIQQITDELIDAMEPKGRADLIDEFAFPLPIIVICELLGVPADRRADLREWSNVFITPAITEEMRERHRAVNQATLEYFAELIAERRAAPRDDLISALVTARDDDKLSEQELLSTLVLLMIAGHETTVNLIGNGMAALLRHPDQMRLLRSRPDLMPSAIEEFLRYESPVQHGTLRIAAEDMEIAGTPIPRGSVVQVCIGAADRDPAVFPAPDRLDITRADNRHLAFGHGIHFCLGAPLARLEGRIAFSTLLTRLPGIALENPDDALAWRVSGSIVRGLTKLLVRF